MKTKEVVINSGFVLVLIGIFSDWYKFMPGLFATCSIVILSGLIGKYLTKERILNRNSLL